MKGCCTGHVKCLLQQLFFRENIVKFCIKHYEKHNIYVIMYRIVKKNIQKED